MALTAKQRHHRHEARAARRRRRHQRETPKQSIDRLLVRVGKAQVGQDVAWPWLFSTLRDHHTAEVDRATSRLQRAKRLRGRS